MDAGEPHPAGDRRRGHLGQLDLPQRSQGPAPAQEQLDRLELVTRDRWTCGQPLELVDGRRWVQLQALGDVATIFDDHDRAGDHVAEAAKHRIASHHDQPDRIAGRQEVGRTQQVAQHRVEHRERVPVLPDHAQPQRSLARRSAAPQRLEEHVVKPVDQEVGEHHRPERHAVEADRDLDQREQQDQHEEDPAPDQQVDQVSDRSPGRTCERVGEAHVFRRLDLGGGVERLEALGEGVHAWGPGSPGRVAGVNHHRGLRTVRTRRHGHRK
jgi:hypothetical protein